MTAYQYDWLGLSIHDLTRRSTDKTESETTTKAFQFTTSQGGRRLLVTSVLDYDIFQFTTSQGGRLQLYFRFIARFVFQFTTSQGGRHVFDER